MKLFQQLLVAPAALGLLAPMAATAAELNINDVSDYAASSEEVKSISQYSDVYPTDWAYQALTNLAERHGCVASNPSGSMTRYEAAALLNKCMSNAAQANEEERRLLNEFAPELAVIKGRADTLEAGIGEYEAGVFSTTTRLSGTTTFIVGGLQTGTSTKNGTTFTYDTKLKFDTSFNGDDLLRTTIRSGNINNELASTGSAPLEVAYNGTNLGVVRSYYQFPISDEFSATIGALVRQDDLLGVWPSSYPSDTILDTLTYAGANAAYNLSEGAGAGITYTKNELVATLAVVSEEQTDSNPESGGVLTEGGSDDITAQVAWVADDWTIAAVYTYSDGGHVTENTGYSSNDDFTAWGLSADWSLDYDNRIVPSSISAGFGIKLPDDENSQHGIGDQTTWSIGVQWADAWVDGNTLGVGVGTSEPWQDYNDGKEMDEPIAVEAFYSMAVSDSITVTPALFVMEKNNTEGTYGALVKTTFNF